MTSVSVPLWLATVLSADNFFQFLIVILTSSRVISPSDSTYVILFATGIVLYQHYIWTKYFKIEKVDLAAYAVFTALRAVFLSSLVCIYGIYMVYSWNTDSYIYIGICGAQDLTVIIALVVNWCKTQTDAQDLDELEPLIRQEPEAQPFQLPTIPFQPPEQPIGF